jgi:hypothetical protein
MLNYLTTPVRAALVAAALVFAAHALEVRAAGPAQALATATTARARTDEDPTDRDAAPVGGLLIIAGVVAGVILLAWICSRIGDNTRGNLMS